jgi:hypothetical protein
MINERIPAIFIGHGSPLNAIEENEFNRTWHHIGEIILAPHRRNNSPTHRNPFYIRALADQKNSGYW